MIGWYVHHHGAGHTTRLACVRPHLANPVTAFGSRPAPNVVPLPMDVGPPRSARCAAASATRSWHYAPLGVEGLRRRMATLATWVEEADPALVVVDVSVEVAALMRLLSVPTVVVRQHGRRDDPPHQRCHDDAALLLAPYPEWMEEDWVPDDLRRRTTYTGGFSRVDGRAVDRPASRRRLGVDPDEHLVVVLGGLGGRLGWPVAPAAAATPGWRWHVLAPVGGPDLPPDSPAGHEAGLSAGAGDRVTAGWADDPWEWLCAADVVVTHGGHNAVMEVAASGTPMVVVPQDRPFDEQRRKAAMLHRHHLATVLPDWPEPSRWAAVLDRAQGLGRGAASSLVDGRGARRAAAAIDGAAARFGSVTDRLQVTA